MSSGERLPRPPTGAGRRYELHLFVCTNDFACIHDGPALEIRKRLKTRLREAGMKDRVRVNQAGCLSQCGHGPMMVVYPEGVWYSHLTLADADRIWDEHVVGGTPVSQLEYETPGPAGNAQPRLVDEAQGLNVVDRRHPTFRACPRCPSR